MDAISRERREEEGAHVAPPVEGGTAAAAAAAARCGMNTPSAVAAEDEQLMRVCTWGVCVSLKKICDPKFKQRKTE